MGTVDPGVRKGLRGLTGLWSRPAGGITVSTKRTNAVTAESWLSGLSASAALPP